MQSERRRELRESPKSTGQEECREWASISSVLLLFLRVKRMFGHLWPSIWDNNKDCGGTQAREAFLWKKRTSYVTLDQTAHPEVKIPVPRHSWWICSTHKPQRGKKPLSVSATSSGIQGLSPPEIFQQEIQVCCAIEESCSRTTPLNSLSPLSPVHDLWPPLSAAVPLQEHNDQLSDSDS